MGRGDGARGEGRGEACGDGRGTLRDPLPPHPGGAGLRGVPGSARHRSGRRAPRVRFAGAAEHGARR